MEMTTVGGREHISLHIVKGRTMRTYDDFVTPERLREVQSLIAASVEEDGPRDHEVVLIVPREGSSVLKQSFWRTERTATQILLTLADLVDETERENLATV